MDRDHFWLNDHQFTRLAPHLPTDTRGKPRVDDCRVISGIVHVLKSGCRWADAPLALSATDYENRQSGRRNPLEMFTLMFAKSEQAILNRYEIVGIFARTVLWHKGCFQFYGIAKLPVDTGDKDEKSG